MIFIKMVNFASGKSRVFQKSLPITVYFHGFLTFIKDKNTFRLNISFISPEIVAFYFFRVLCVSDHDGLCKLID